MKIQISEKDMLRILTSAVRQIKAEQKNEPDAAGSKKKGTVLHEKDNTQKTQKEDSGRHQDHSDRSGRCSPHCQHVDRLSDPDIRTAQRDERGGG